MTTVDVGSTMPSIAGMLNYTTSFAFGSCENERLGRTMAMTKTNLRSLLGDDVFFALCYVKNEMPSLEAVDYLRIVKAWYESGHCNARSRRRALYRKSDVSERLKREAAKRDHTPIGTKKV